MAGTRTGHRPVPLDPTVARALRSSAGRRVGPRTGGDRDVAHDILTDYVDSLHTDLGALGGALTDANEEDVRRVAHRLNSAARTVWAREVAELSARLEVPASTPVDEWGLLRSTAGDLDAASVWVARARLAAPRSRAEISRSGLQ